MTITAKIIADSINPDSIRITTLQLRYPKFIHGEFLTHRVFSRNSSSSRAIPVERLIQDVIDDPVIPSFWGSNKPGMQAGAEIDDPVTVDLKTWVLNPTSDKEGERWNNAPFYNPRTFTRQEAWLEARDAAIETARGFAKAGYHKQIVNRLIEPWCHINTVCTSTEWDNFFKLRCHPDAQPEMRALAEAMRGAINESKPQLLGWESWHLPYVDETRELAELPTDRSIEASVARCARVSYLTHDQRQTTIEEETNGDAGGDRQGQGRGAQVCRRSHQAGAHGAGAGQDVHRRTDDRAGHAARRPRRRRQGRIQRQLRRHSDWRMILLVRASGPQQQGQE